MAQQTFEELVDAVMQAESRGKRYKDDGKTLTTSPKGALGEMQVMPKTSRDPGFGVVPAKDKSPDEIARVGKDYLQAMLGKYGDTEKALIAYNWGPGVTDKWLAAGADPKKLPAETKTYVERVKGFLGGNVPRETSVAKKEREPLPPSLPPMAQAPTIKPEAAARVASLGPGYQAALALSFLAETDDEEDRKTTITQEYLAKAQEEEDDRAAAAAVSKRQSNVFADLSNTTIRSPFAEPQQPVMMKDGGDVGDRLTPQQIEQYVGQKTKAQLLLEKFKEQAHPRNYTSIIGLGPNIVYETYKYATGKDPLRDLQKELQKKIDYEVDTGSEPIGTDSGPISGSLPPIRRANGSPEEGEDLTKPSFGNPNIRKQGEAARRLAAMRDVNTLPDPKTYAAVAGALGTRPDQMGFSVLNPKYKEIMDVANPAFYAGTALQIAPAVQALGGGKAAKMLSNMAGQEFNAALMGERPGTLLDMLTAPAQPKFMFVRARPEAAARHADLQAQGLSPEQIRAQNLTLVDNRGNLLEEISDAPAVLQQKTASVPRMYYDMLKHPELQSIYPAYDMPDVRIGTTRRKNAPLAAASFGEKEGIQGTVRSLPGDDVRGTVRGTLLHEGQHAIQSMEGFTEGANPSSFVAYIKAKRGIYDADPTVNENVIREMERIYPNLPDVTDRIGQDLKARYGKVFPSDKRMGEALYRHMPGEVQAELARIRSNLTPDELKATPLEVSMQQLNINPANILEMNKMGSRLDRQIGDLEYDVYGYANGGVVHRAEGSPKEGERKLDPETIRILRNEGTSPASLKRVAPPLELNPSAAGLPGLMMYDDPSLTRTTTSGYILDGSDDKKNVGMAQAMFLNPSKGERADTVAHETEHLLARQNLGSGANVNSKFDELIGDKGNSRLKFVRKAVELGPYLEEKYNIKNAYFDPKMLEFQSKFGMGKNLLYEQLASLSAAEQRLKVDLTKDPELRKTLFSRPDVRETYNAITGLRQTRLDPRDLSPYTRVAEPGMLDAIKGVFKRAEGGPVYRANGSPEEGERLTPQQIERIAAQETAEREALSTPAFIAQKSGIGRKAGPVSQALQSGQGQIEFLKGMTNVPQNILGAPMDISNMIANVYGGGVEKPFMGSEYIKEKLRAQGLGFTPSTDPTLAGFYGAGDLGSNLVNPAGVTRAGVQAAGKTGEAAKMLAQDLQQYNQNLAVPGASYAVRNKGTPVAMSGLPFLSNVDEAEFLVKGVIGSGKKPLESTDKSLSNWFSKTVTRYLRSDFATPDDQLVRAAKEGKLLHVAPKDFSDSADDQILKNFLERRQSDLEYMRQAEGFGNTNMATQPYAQRIEDITDISAYPERVGDLTPNRIPQGMRDIVQTRPETRVTDYAPGIAQNLKLDELRDKMLEVRQSNSLYGAYGQPAVKIPEDYLLSDDTLVKLNVAAASNRMAKYTNWQDNTRQRMATTALREDPRFTRAPLQDGKYLGVALPDVRQNPEVKQLVLDVGCDGGWCTRYSQNAKAYGSGDSRLHIMVTGEGKKARPVAQFAITDSGADDLSRRFSISEIKEKGNTADFANNPALPAIQEYVQFLDNSYGGLDYVDNLKGLRMTQLPEYPNQVFNFFDPTFTQKMDLADKFGTVENGMRAVRDKAVDLNNGSRFVVGNDTDMGKMLEQATNFLVPTKQRMTDAEIKANIQKRINPSKALGGMIERQPNDNRRYM